MAWSCLSSSIGMWQRMKCSGSTSASGGSSSTQIGAEKARAACVEHAARGRIGGGGNVAFEVDPHALLALDRRNGREQRLRVGVVWGREHGLGGAELHQPTEVENRNPVREVAHHPEVVADEHVARAVRLLQVDEEIQDRGLNRHVERRRRLVAHDKPWISRERTRDRNSLLLAAGQAGGTRRECALRKTHRLDEIHGALLGRSAPDVRELSERALEHAPHGVAAVERRVGVLEDDLKRRDVPRRAAARAAAPSCARRPRRCPKSARRSRAGFARTSSCRCPTPRRARASRRPRAWPRRRRGP